MNYSLFFEQLQGLFGEQHSGNVMVMAIGYIRRGLQRAALPLRDTLYCRAAEQYANGKKHEFFNVRFVFKHLIPATWNPLAPARGGMQ